MAKRLCITCKHFGIDLDVFTSCPTCGPDISLTVSCEKNVFDGQEAKYDEVTTLRRVSKHAATCGHYQEANE